MSNAYLPLPVPQHPKGNMTQTPISVSERRLAIARRLYEAPVDQDPGAITLCDGKGRVVTHHYPAARREFSGDCLIVTGARALTSGAGASSPVMFLPSGGERDVCTEVPRQYG